MKCIISKSSLAVILSSLEGFDEPKVRHEQYAMDSEIGASMLWNAYLLGDIEGKLIVDLGCGTGIIGIGALLLGTRRLIFVDSDKKALNIAKNNFLKIKSEGYKLGIAEFICQDIKKLDLLDIKADLVLENPPFGTKIRHKDVLFLQKALKIAPVVYSFHKSETKVFLKGFADRNHAEITHIWDYKFPLKPVFVFHRRQIHRIDVSCFRFKNIFK